ncbi:ATP-binding cassette domain-containing protein [Protofrankia coriariae]|uniref:ATP-binding cassette domain-containing protein n=1 Tax=Protofrankia coriariae TaxID=1562887 RepID=UPI0006998A72|nr:ATP-binding cassette domain-containing protein [Protofrankia coriariae]
MKTAILAEGLKKRYRETDALAGVDLAVSTGSVLGLLGPNGAGKTTTVRVLATLLRPDAGRAEVAGADVLTRPDEVRRRIGFTGQNAAVDALLTGRENLVLVGTLLHLGRSAARARATALLEEFGLTEAADRPIGTYSGGMRRRLDLAACLVGRPSVLFLDEPTAGLDPVSRMTLWQAVRRLVDDGVTVLLTTQYLEEADYLADQIVVISAGQVIADGTPDELKRKIGQEWLEVSVLSPASLATALAVLAPLAVAAPTVDEAKNKIALRLRDGMEGVVSVAVSLRDAGVDITDFALRKPSLDDVFLALLGHPTTQP